MAIVKCTEIDLEGERSYVTSLADGVVGKRTFIAVSDDGTDTEASAMSGAQSVGPNPLPIPFSLFPGSTVAKCHSLTPARPFKDRKHWKITADYKSIFSQSEKDRAGNENPCLRPTIITGVSRTIMIPVRTMLRSSAYKTFSAGLTFTLTTAANSAGDPLDPPIEMASTQWEVHCERNVSSLPGWFLNPLYQNGVNAADQLITIRGTSYVMPAGYAKLSNLTFSDSREENGFDYITISWNTTFQTPRPLATGETVAPGPWDVERLDEGMRIRKKIGTGPSASSKWDNVKDASGTTTLTTPVPFDGNGAPIKSDGAGIPEADLYKFCYRPFGQRVNYSVIPWS